jgi:hypothetical protein
VDHASLLQNAEMMRHQIRGQPELGSQLTWRGIARDQAINDGEPERFPQGGEHGDSAILGTVPESPPKASPLATSGCSC